MLFLFLLTIYIVFYTIYYEKIKSFLSLHDPLATNSYIIEGWLPGEALDRVRPLLEEADRIYTVGGPLPEEYVMAENGYLIFSLDSFYKENIQEIKLIMKGQRAGNVFPRFRVLVNDEIEIGEGFVAEEFDTFSYQVNEPKLASLLIHYDNDGYTRYRDRNLAVKSVIINGELEIKARSPGVYYDKYKLDSVNILPAKFTNYADVMAWRIISSGIRGSTIRSVTNHARIINRTFSSARDLFNYGSREGNLPDSVNLISYGTHARRSWIIFSKVLGPDIKTGVVRINPGREFPYNHFSKSYLMEFLSISKELFGCLVYSIYLNMFH